MSKPSTPVRRSKVGPGRPGSAGGEIPLTASMEVLTPDPCVPPHMAPSDLGRPQDVYVPAAGSKPRTPGSATLVRTRSTDGRRSAHGHSGPHEVIPLNSTTSKSFSTNPILAQPLTLPSGGASPASSIVLGTSGAGGLPPQSPYTGGPAAGGTTPSGASSVSASGGGGILANARVRTPPDQIAMSTASSRFNPVMEDDDALPPLSSQPPPWQQQQQSHPQLSSSGNGMAQQGSGDPSRESQVVMSGTAAAIAQRAASSGNHTSSRRYAGAADSLALSTQQQQQRPQTGEGCGGAAGDGGDGGGKGGAGLERYSQDQSAPATPGSVASGRVGGVFFTDLHRSFGGSRGRGVGVGDSQDLRGSFGNGVEEFDGEQDGDAMSGGRSSRQGVRISAMTSRLNPMQSPTMSEDGDDDDNDVEFAEYAGEALRSVADTTTGSGAVVEEEDARRASTSAMTDYTNPVQTPNDSRLPTPLLPSAAGAAPPPEEQPSTAAPSTAASTTEESRRSLLLVIRDLYVAEPKAQTPAAADDPSRPTTAASEPPLVATDTEPGEIAGGDGEVMGDEAEALAASRAAVAALAARADSQQSARRSELGEYMTSLQDLKDESGGRLVELPADWGVMLERLFRQRRAEFATLEGWMGPRRFEDLPINQLPSDHPDPRVEEGLVRIRELDAVLNDKLIAALISHRETFPEQWAEQERRRLERHTKAVEEALKRERQKRLRAGRLSRAVTSLDGPAGAAGAPADGESSRSLLAAVEQPPSIYSRLFTLKPEEEALLETVLKRNDEEGAAINPFDLESAATYGAGPVAAVGAGTAAAAASSDVWADTDDIDLDIDMLLPSASTSACATPSLAAAPRLRPLSARRLTEADGGGGGGAGALRPLSASSYTSSSRPGTSSGLIGGMSAIAAAALHGHPALLAASAAAAAAAAGGGSLRASAAGGAGRLLPERVYEDPRVAARALRAINARLAAFESEHLWDESGGLADFKSVVAQQQQQQQARKPAILEASAGPGSAGGGAAASAATTGAGAGPTGPVAGAGALPSSSAGGARVQSPPRSVRSAAGGPAGSVSGVSITAGGQRDYLREERLAKELANRERDVDAAIRSLKTGDVVRLGEATLKALVEQCRRLQELNEHRRKIEEAEAAARKAQLQRQQLMAARASESGSARGTPRGGSAPSISGNSRGQTPPLPATAAGGAAARTGVGAASSSIDGGTPASAGSGRASAKPAGVAVAAVSGSPGGGGAGGGASGAGGGGAPTRQGSAGKSRSGSAAPGTSSSSSAPRRASDPATAPSGGGPAPGGTTPTSTSGSSSSSKGGRAAAAAAPAGSTAPAAGSGVPPKPRSAGRSAGPLSPLDGGGLPPPPPPPPP
ncbi:hypothetical protein PLESTM_000055600 [Pleodorina starrii]|nr:hypothetical protein PLESTM_000055600 [Pleodorina starrii]